MRTRSLAVAGVATLFLACGQPILTPDAGAHLLEFAVDATTPRTGECVQPVGAPECAVVQLQVGSVRDSDVNEVLAARWFVDGGLASAAELPPWGSHSESRPGTSFDFLPASFAKGSHEVKLIVSNGFSTTGPHDQVAEGKLSAQLTWCIDTSACANTK